MQGQRGLLRGRLGAHKLHPQLLNRQPDRTGIGGIGFVAADKGAHNFGVQQSHRVPESAQFTCPVVRTTTGFDGHQARGEVGKVLRYLGALDLYVNLSLPYPCSRCASGTRVWQCPNSANARLKVASLGSECKAQIKAAQAAQFAVGLQSIHQRSGGLQVQFRFGQERTRQGTAVRLGLPHAAPLCLASVAVDRQLDMGELKSTDDLLEFWVQTAVILLHQSDEFALQGAKSLDCHGTQGTIHGRAPSSDFDTLIFPRFGRCPQLCGSCAVQFHGRCHASRRCRQENEQDRLKCGFKTKVFGPSMAVTIQRHLRVPFFFCGQQWNRNLDQKRKLSRIFKDLAGYARLVRS